MFRSVKVFNSADVQSSLILRCLLKCLLLYWWNRTFYIVLVPYTQASMEILNFAHYKLFWKTSKCQIPNQGDQLNIKNVCNIYHLNNPNLFLSLPEKTLIKNQILSSKLFSGMIGFKTCGHICFGKDCMNDNLKLLFLFFTKTGRGGGCLI